MRFLSSKDLLLIHSMVVDETGGSHGIRDLGLLESAVAGPQHSFGGHDLYPSLHDKAAALLFSLIKNHPFVDGNKRTAITAAGVFLESNRYRLTANQSSVVEFTLNIASNKTDVNDVPVWLRQNTKPLK